MTDIPTALSSVGNASLWWISAWASSHRPYSRVHWLLDSFWKALRPSSVFGTLNALLCLLFSAQLSKASICSFTSKETLLFSFIPFSSKSCFCVWEEWQLQQISGTHICCPRLVMCKEPAVMGIATLGSVWSLPVPGGGYRLWVPPGTAQPHRSSFQP